MSRSASNSCLQHRVSATNADKPLGGPEKINIIFSKFLTIFTAFSSTIVIFIVQCVLAVKEGGCILTVYMTINILHLNLE